MLWHYSSFLSEWLYASSPYQFHDQYHRLLGCEFSLGPEVATLFGREIGQSNGDILLTGVKPARIKVG